MMETQEEEEEKKIRSLCSLSCHVDLISEILLRLPVKSVMRSRCVSKLWWSTTTHPCFINSFAARSSQSSCLFVFANQGDNLVGFSLPEQGNSDKSSSSGSPLDSYVIKYPKGCCFAPANSVHGLICFQSFGRFLIWNPTMRRFSTLTKPESCWRDTSGFIGHDPIDGTYKALCIRLALDGKRNRKGNNQPRILTLGGAQESWRFIQGSFEHYPYYSLGKCINGVLYYESCLNDDFTGRFMMSFHVRSEKFSMVQVPWKRSTRVLINYEGKLASVAPSSDDQIALWILEDAERHEWSFTRICLPFPPPKDPVSQRSLELVGVTDAGEFIYVPEDLLSPFHVMYFDPKRSSFRRVVYEGLVDDEFRRRNGLDNNAPLFRLHAIPNHIECLMSL